MTRTVGLRSVTAALLAAAWLVTWLYFLDYSAKAGPNGGIPYEVLFSGFAMCGVAGALARFAGRPGGRLRDGAAAGVLMWVTYMVGGLAISLLLGQFQVGLGEGETLFSTLIELPFWLGVPFGLGAALGVGGWLAANAIAHGEAKRGAR